MRPVAVATLIMAAFGSIAKKAIDVETDAPLYPNYRQIPYARVNRRSGRSFGGSAPVLHAEAWIGTLREARSHRRARIRSIAGVGRR
jgi:hypothetical protein